MDSTPTYYRRSLKQHEEIIESGLNYFFDVGQSLMAIRDEKLYQAAHDTFEDYCKKRWGFAKTRAYQLIESSVVVSDLKTSTNGGQKDAIIPENERQARAVADAAPDSKTRAVVWKAAVESAPKDADGKPKVTAAVVKKAAATVTGTRTSRNGKAKHKPSPPPKPKERDRLSLPYAIEELNACLEETQKRWPLDEMKTLVVKLRKFADQIEKSLKS